MDQQRRPAPASPAPTPAPAQQPDAGPGNAAFAAQLPATIGPRGPGLLDPRLAGNAFPVDPALRATLRPAADANGALAPTHPADQAGVALPVPAPAPGPLSPDGLTGHLGADLIDPWWADPYPAAPVLPEKARTPTPFDPSTVCGGAPGCDADLGFKLKSPPIPIPIPIP